MRKFKALIAVLTAAVLVFSLVGTAFAASAPSDVQGTKYEVAAGKLMALGISSGWGGGQFNPSAAVTRAQFSVLVVNELGLKDAAAALQGTDTQFKDVKGSYWASGAIQVATTKGIISGYGDGTFRPEQPITYMEAAILTVRALGYREADPNAHFIKAIELGLMADVDGKANQTAIRGNLAIILNNMLTKEIGQVDKDGVWVSSKKTPQDALGIKVVKGTLEAVAADGTTVTVAGAIYKVDSKTTLIGAAKYMDAIGYEVEIGGTNPGIAADSAPLAYVAVTTKASSIKTGVVELTDNASYIYLKGDTTKYVFASPTVYLNGAPGNLNSFAVGDNVTLVLDAQGKVTVIKVAKFTVAEKLVKATYTAGTPNTISISSDGSVVSATYAVAPNAVITRNGAAATVKDLIPDQDIIYLVVGAGNQITYAEAYYKEVSGTVTATKTVSDPDNPAGIFMVTVGGKDYKASKNAINLNAEKSFSALAKGDVVKFVLNKDGDVTILKSVTTAASTGKVLGWNVSDTAGTVTMDIRGTSTTFNLAIDSVTGKVYADAATAVKALKVGDIAKLTLDADGKVIGAAKVDFPTAAVAIDSVLSGSNAFTVAGTVYLVDSNSIMYKDGTYVGFAGLYKGLNVKFNSKKDVSGANIVTELIADSACVVDQSKISATTSAITGIKGAVEPQAVVKVYSDASLAETALVGSSANADEYGAFTYNGTFTSGATYYVKVTDTFNNSTSFAVEIS